jgi:nitrite reductase/ring-hydroxylating ferredoxin subunit
MFDKPKPQVDSIPLAEIREGEINVKILGSGRKVLIVKQGPEVRVFHEVCPHMGADLSEGIYCAHDRTLHCPWHGYVFSTEDGRFVSNPNERFMALLRSPSPHFKPEKTPRYRLSPVPFVVTDGRIVFGKEVPGAERPLMLVDNATNSDGGAP